MSFAWATALTHAILERSEALSLGFVDSHKDRKLPCPTFCSSDFLALMCFTYQTLLGTLHQASSFLAFATWFSGLSCLLYV
jgi:hypothetical protein